MKLVRVLDERMVTLQRQGRIGFYGAATGEEGAIIGSAAALLADDWVFPALRQGGVLLYRGLPLIDYLSQVFANVLDIHKGHQMPCHFSHRKFHHVAWSSCIATQLPQAVGAAYAARYKKEKNVVVGYLGEGATSEGDFHVALNFAGVFNAPVVFFCQNNQWAISVPREQQTASTSIAIKGSAYGIPGVLVDGNDVLACYDAMGKAMKQAREGRGPTLIEAVTYRMGPHSTSDDPKLYRDERVVATWKKRDPILRLRLYLEHEKIWNEEKEKALVSRLDNEISDAISKAESLPPPPNHTLFEDTYKEQPWHLKEQAAGLSDEVRSTKG